MAFRQASLDRRLHEAVADHAVPHDDDGFRWVVLRHS
jgi:hypothetical protein